jgi:hypothetical protein
MTRVISAAICFIVFFSISVYGATPTCSSDYEVDALNSYGGGVNCTKATIAAALAAIGTSNKATLLLRPGAWVINARADWSAYANVTVKIVPGATLQVADGVTVTIPNLDETGLHQRFVCAGKGTVAGIKEPRPEWWGAYNDGTHAAETTAAICAAQAGSVNGKLRLTKGTYLVSRAINLSRDWILEGAGRKSTIIKRTDTTAEMLDGISTTTVLYISGTWVNVRDLTITGTVAAVNGISFSNAGPSSHVNCDRLDIEFCKTAITETKGLFMATFNNVNVAQCENAFSFITANGKTSLTFNSCYASSVGQAWDFRNTVYSVLNSCGADWANWAGTKPNPSGGGYGNPATAKGVYHFFTSSVVMNGCGAEGCYGNGVVGVEIGSNIMVNNLTSYSCRSAFVPDYAKYPNYAVGPIQTGTSACRLFITGLHTEDWHNTAVDSSYPTKPVAGAVAFNYDEAAGGAQVTNMVLVGGASGASSVTFAGNGPWRKYCLTTNDLTNVVRGDNKTISAPIVVTGTGTKILIPIKSQTTTNRKHYLKITGLDGAVHGSIPCGFQGECFFVSRNSGPINFTTFNLQNITSLARNAENAGVEVTLSASRTNPMIMLEILSEQPSLIDIEHITLK